MTHFHLFNRQLLNIPYTLEMSMYLRRDQMIIKINLNNPE